MFSENDKILIADDMSTMRKIIQKSLMNLGFRNFVLAKDGLDAWNQLESDSDIKIIVSDWNMPNLSGLDLLMRVRAHEVYGKLPFILVTAESDLAQIKQALEAGVDDYIVKPFSAATLQKKISGVYQRYEKRAAS